MSGNPGAPGQLTLHDGSTEVNFAYDDRDRCVDIDLGSQQLAAYQWLGSAIHKRTVTCDYPGSTKLVFDTAFTRDGLRRVTQVASTLLTLDQDEAGYNDLGTYG